MLKFLLVDNYDSFTFNLKAIFERFNVNVYVVRNDTFESVSLEDFDALIISPGPSLPKDAGNLMKLLRENPNVPTLGICLGMQAIGEVYGGVLELLDRPMHGIQTEIFHDHSTLFTGIPESFLAARYHSWQLCAHACPKNIKIVAHDCHNNIMGIQVIDAPIFGFQFHPESILTPQGPLLIKNFIEFVHVYKNEKYFIKTA